LLRLALHSVLFLIFFLFSYEHRPVAQLAAVDICPVEHHPETHQFVSGHLQHVFRVEGLPATLRVDRRQSVLHAHGFFQLPQMMTHSCGKLTKKRIKTERL